MALKAGYEFLFVGRDDNSFLENYAYDLFQDHGERSGQIFVNLEVQNNPVDAEEVAAAIFETTQRAFFEDINLDAYDRFEYSLKAINDVLNDMRTQKISGYLGNLNIIVAAIVGDTLHLSNSGDSEAYLIRKRYVSVVTEGLNESSVDEGDVFVNIASGKIEAGDFVLFSSTRLLRYLGKSDLARLVSPRSVSVTLSEIRDVVSSEILGRVGLTGILFEAIDQSDYIDFDVANNHATETILESPSASRVYAERDSISGKFLTTLGFEKGPEPRKFSRGAGYFAVMIDTIKSFFLSSSKTKLLGLLVTLIVILLVGGWFAKGQSQQELELARLDEVLTGVQSKISQAQTKGVFDKEQARLLLDQAFDEAKSVLDTGLYREKAYLYLSEIEAARDSLDGVVRVKDYSTFLDLSSFDSQINALGLVSLEQKLYVYGEHNLYEIILDQLQEPVVLDETESVVASTVFDQNDSLIFLTKSGKLIEYRDQNISFMDTDDGVFRKGIAMDDWGNRIYILDPDSNQVWRYSLKGDRSSFGSGEAYLADNSVVDFAKAEDLAIDANIYVLTSEGDISKLFSGKKADFSINSQPFDTYKFTDNIFTDENLNQIFVFDSEQARLYVFTKDKGSSGNITYSKQYLFEGLEGDVRDFYFNADEKRFYMLTENKIFTSDLL